VLTDVFCYAKPQGRLSCVYLKWSHCIKVFEQTSCRNHSKAAISVLIFATLHICCIYTKGKIFQIWRTVPPIKYTNKLGRSWPLWVSLDMPMGNYVVISYFQSQLGTDSVEAIASVHGKAYQTGTISQVICEYCSQKLHITLTFTQSKDTKIKLQETLVTSFIRLTVMV